MNHHPELQDRAGQSGSVMFTPRAEVALDELAAVIAARCSHTPAGIALVLDEVMHTDLADLTGAPSAIAVAAEQHSPGKPHPGMSICLQGSDGPTDLRSQ